MATLTTTATTAPAPAPAKSAFPEFDNFNYFARTRSPDEVRAMLQRRVAGSLRLVDEARATYARTQQAEDRLLILYHQGYADALQSLLDFGFC